MPDTVPADSAADRNLLFGALALQLDFISRDQFVAALNTWVLHKDKSLGRLLQERGPLAPEMHELLEAIVRKHLQLHGGQTHSAQLEKERPESK